MHWRLFIKKYELIYIEKSSTLRDTLMWIFKIYTIPSKKKRIKPLNSSEKLSIIEDKCDISSD